MCELIAGVDEEEPLSRLAAVREKAKSSKGAPAFEVRLHVSNVYAHCRDVHVLSM